MRQISHCSNFKTRFPKTTTFANEICIFLPNSHQKLLDSYHRQMHSTSETKSAISIPKAACLAHDYWKLCMVAHAWLHPDQTTAMSYMWGCPWKVFRNFLVVAFCTSWSWLERAVGTVSLAPNLAPNVYRHKSRCWPLKPYMVWVKIPEGLPTS